MTFESTTNLVEQYKVLDNLTARELERLKECEVSLEVALRQKFGNRLSEIMVQDIVGNVSRNPDIFHYVVTGDTTQANPKNRASFLPIAEIQVQGSELARRNLAFSDASLRTKLESEFIQSMRPEDRMKYARDGTIVNRIAEYVETELDKY